MKYAINLEGLKSLQREAVDHVIFYVNASLHHGTVTTGPPITLWSLKTKAK